MDGNAQYRQRTDLRAQWLTNRVFWLHQAGKSWEITIVRASHIRKSHVDWSLFTSVPAGEGIPAEGDATLYPQEIGVNINHCPHSEPGCQHLHLQAIITSLHWKDFMPDAA